VLDDEILKQKIKMRKFKQRIVRCDNVTETTAID